MRPLLQVWRESPESRPRILFGLLPVVVMLLVFTPFIESTDTEIVSRLCEKEHDASYYYNALSKWFIQNDGIPIDIDKPAETVLLFSGVKNYRDMEFMLMKTRSAKSGSFYVSLNAVRFDRSSFYNVLRVHYAKGKIKSLIQNKDWKEIRTSSSRQPPLRSGV